MRYYEFFEIQIGHQYFSKEEWVDVLIVPDNETHQLLKGLHCFVKGTKNGLRVLVETGELKPAISLDQTLTFEVYPASATFHTYTDTSDLASGGFWIFSNASLLNDFQLTASISSGVNKSLNGFQLVAKIEIHPTTELLDVTIAKPYTISFKAKLATWKYYFITDPATKNLSIEDKGKPALQFNKLDLQNDTVDQVAIALRANFPDAGLLLFESASPVPRQSTGRKNIQLIQDGQIIIRHLPNPTVEDMDIKIIKVLK